MDAPALFVSHGSPLIALEHGDFESALHAWAHAQARPAGLLVVSAHFVTEPELRITASTRPETVHDFGGFPAELYRLRWPAPGSPELAARVAALVRPLDRPVVLDAERGLDHGAWVPLRMMFPDADVPTVQLSIPAPADFAGLVALGRALRPLRDAGIWLVCSGGLVHNFRRLAWDAPGAPVEPWAVAAEEALLARVRAHDVDGALALARTDAGVRLAAPTPEHLAPLFVALGAAADEDSLEDVYVGFRHATLSMRTVAFGGVTAPGSSRPRS